MSDGGIVSTSPGDVTVSVDSIATTDDASPAILTMAGGTTSITANSIQTAGAASDGMDAHGTGSIAISAGTVTTSGIGSVGTRAYSDQGDVTIASTSLTTTGDNAVGILGVALSGNVHIDAADVNTFGYFSDGVYASTLTLGAYGQVAGVGGTASIDAGTVTTGGAGANGLMALGSSADITLTGAVHTSGVEAVGIIAEGLDGDASVHNGGSVTTTGYGGIGIQTQSTGSITIDGGGSVATTGDFALGIRAEVDGGANGAITIDQTSVSTDGGRAGAIYAGAFDYYHTGGATDIAIQVGDVATKGSQSRGIVAVDQTTGGNVDITVTGTVSTRQEWSTGIAAVATDGTSTMDAHEIDTNGPHSVAAYALGQSASATVGTIDTLGDYSTGVVALSSAGNAVVNAGTVSTGGDHAYGIQAIANGGDIAITSGSIATAGLQSAGIVAIAYTGDISVTAGKVTTTGKQGYGIYALAAKGDATIQAGQVTTSGYSSAGIQLVALDGAASVTASDVETKGDASEGLAVLSETGTTITAASVSTAGNHSNAIGAYSEGVVKVTTTGHIATAGSQSYGIFAEGGASGGLTVSNQGDVMTSGYHAHAIYAVGSTAPSITLTNLGTVETHGNDADGILGLNAGSITISNSGSVTTSGVDAVGVGAIAFDTISDPIDLSIVSKGSVVTSGADSVAILADIVGDPDNASRGAETVAVSAGSVKATGDGSVGIRTVNAYGATTVSASDVVATGAGSVGIAVQGGGPITVQAGNVASAASAIYATGKSTSPIAFDVTGKVASSGGDGILAVNGGGQTSVTVGSGGSIAGAGDGIAIESAGGTVSVVNAGTLSGGAGYALDVSNIPVSAQAASLTRKLVPVLTTAAPSTRFTNSGTLVGAVKLGGGDDVVSNSGTFVATKDSDFGAGQDFFANSGSVQLAGGGMPATVHFLGLETFQNAGLVDLRNGVAGDTLTLGGNYVGSGNATLGLDVGANGVTDKLVVTGAATGSTRILLDGSVSSATLLAKPVTLVQTGAGSSAGAFTLAVSDVGFIHYGLAFDAASGGFQLTSGAGAPVYRFTRLGEAAGAIWRESAGAWSTHMAELRDNAEPAQRVWGQAYGGVDTRHGDTGGYDSSYRQDYYGGQAGIDLAGKRDEDGQGVLFGLTGGYLSSRVSFLAAADRVRFDTENLGGYASLRKGPVFANLLGQYVHYHADADNGVEHWSDHLGGNGYGVQAEVGARLGGERFFVEPVASLAWQRTDLDTLHALGQALDFGHQSAVTGKLGARAGGTTDVGHGTTAVLYARADYVHSFQGRGSLLFSSGGTSETVLGTTLGDYGEGAIGVNILSAGRLSGFIEGDGDIGHANRGGGGRVGIRFKL